MIRRTMAASVDDGNEVAQAEAWLASNSNALAWVAEEGGCGCCIRAWRLEGPEDVLATIPPTLTTSDAEWDTA
jgi:hypothetical protein